MSKLESDAHYARDVRLEAVHVDTLVGAPAGVLRVTIIWVMVFVSVLSWRTDTYYSGGLDPVVLAKTSLGLTAFWLAVTFWIKAGKAWFCGVRTVSIVALYVSASVIGAAADGAVLASTVIAVRVLLLLATLVFLVQSTSARTVVDAMAWSCAAVPLMCSAPSLGSALSGQRLVGVLLPLNPNQIAMMFGASLLVVTWSLTAGSRTPWVVLSAAGLLGLIWLTGSRTGLVAVLAAIGVLVLLTRRLPIILFATLCGAVPVAFYLMTQTALLAQFFARGGEANVTTLSSRTIAWHAAFGTPLDSWRGLLGRGLAAKTVDVSGAYWNTQVLDSSWVSAFVQAGLVGLALLALWVLVTAWDTLRSLPPGRPLWVAMAAYCFVWSFTASGLLDAYVLFILMAVTSLASERPARAWSALADASSLPPHATAVARPARADRPLRTVDGA